MDTAAVPSLRAKDYASDVKPIWCPGCGHYAVLSALTKALAFLGLPKDEVVVVSGIGCSSRIPAYIDGYGFHGLHGRALPLATGLKAARPELTVIAAGGDGDGFSIGGNHFLHACRRNMDITCIVMDNEVYGMTKGQASPTTPGDWTQSKLTPHGTGVRRFKPAAIALAAGASFIARGFAGEPRALAHLMAQAIEHPGFAFLHVLSPCRTFRPEQHQAWKAQVHTLDSDCTDNAVHAAERVQRDDGMATGLFYAEVLPVYAPGGREEPGALESIEAEFC